MRNAIKSSEYAVWRHDDLPFRRESKYDILAFLYYIIHREVM